MDISKNMHDSSPSTMLGKLATLPEILSPQKGLEGG